MEVGKKYKRANNYDHVIYECVFSGWKLSVVRYQRDSVNEFCVPSSDWHCYQEYIEPVVHRRWVFVHSTPGGLHFSSPKKERSYKFPIAWKQLAVFPIEYTEAP